MARILAWRETHDVSKKCVLNLFFMRRFLVIFLAAAALLSCSTKEEVSVADGQTDAQTDAEQAAMIEELGY